jgi:hypothetical protein
LGFFINLLSPPIKKKLRKYVEFLSTGSDEEIGQLLAWATIARETLIDAEEAFEILNGETPFMYTAQTEKTIAAITQIKPTEIRFKKETQHQPFGGPLLGGFVVWKMTIFCLIGKKGELFDTEGYVLGRRIWNEMNRGIPYVKDNLKVIDEMSGGQLPIYGWHYDNCNYIPEMFNSNR